jgi:broad specificity phosphatase PhoE
MYHPPIMSRPNACAIYLIRHGRTEWNVTGRWQGHLDVPLDSTGRQQAQRLARRLSDEGTRFGAFYASDLSRAWETAQAVGAALGMAPAAEPALREIDLGAWAGKTRAEIAEQFPAEWGKLQTDEDIPRGGGETFAGFQQRVLDWLERAADKHAGGRICAVTHGGCIRAAALHALGWTWADRERVPPIENGSINILERADGAWRILRMNDVEGIQGEDGEEGHPELNEGQLS